MTFFKNLLPVWLIITICSCTDNADLRVDTNDANGISRALVLSQRTPTAGDLPAASTDPTSPVLKDRGDSTFMFGWSQANIYPSLVSGEISGFYVQVKGADHYYKISSKNATVNAGGVGFGFVIENSAKPGSFTIRYSVFDSKERVSNVMEQVVFVMDYGGSSPMFSFDAKQSVKQITVNGTSQKQVTVVGVSNKFSINDQLICIGQPNKLFTNTIENLLKEYSYVFKSGGSGTLFISSSSTNLDRAASNSACAPTYTTTNSKTYYEGKWGFINKPNCLLIEFSRIDTINGVRHEYPGSHTRLYSVYSNGAPTWKSRDDNKEEILFK